MSRMDRTAQKLPTRFVPAQYTRDLSKFTATPTDKKIIGCCAITVG